MCGSYSHADTVLSGFNRASLAITATALTFNAYLHEPETITQRGNEMVIYVVKTCDGPVYFDGRKSAGLIKARDMAAEQVTGNDMAKYEPEDVAEVVAAIAGKKWDKLYDALETCGAIRKEQLRN